jgi:Domain of unknown function (DUF6429)
VWRIVPNTRGGSTSASGARGQPTPGCINIMEVNADKIDEAVLGLLFLTLHDQHRAWKGIDWDVLDRLYRKGLIENPATKAKSVRFTGEGLRRAEAAFKRQYAQPPAAAGEGRVHRHGNTKVLPAGGTTGFICRSAIDGRPFFRTYAPDGTFVDYELSHDDLEVTISAEAQASFYRTSGENILDHSPAVLGRTGKEQH